MPMPHLLSNMRSKKGILEGPFLLLDLVCVSLSFVWGVSLTMLPILAFQLGSNFVEIGLIATAFSLVYGIGQPLWGTLSDRLGRRKIFVVLGMALSGLMFLVVGFAETTAQIILARSGVGLFIAAVVPTAQALTADISPPEKYGKNLGALNASMSIGFAFGLGLSGALADLLGIRNTLILCAAISLAASALSLALRAPATPRRYAGRPDYESLPATLSLRRFGGIPSKALPPLYLVAFLYTFGEGLIGMFFPIYLLQLGLSKSALGFILFLRSGVATLLTVPAGSLSDVYGRKPAVFLGVILYGFGYLLLLFSSSLWGLAAAQVITGIGAAAFVAGGNALVADVTEPSNRAVAMGFYNASTSLAWAVSSIAGGTVADKFGLFMTLSFVPVVLGLTSFLSLLGLKETLPRRSGR